MKTWTKNLAIAVPLWGFALLVSSCEEAVSLPAENCKKIIKETVSFLEIKVADHYTDGKKKKEKSSLGSIRYDLLSLFVLVHSRQDIMPDDKDEKKDTDTRKKQLLSDEQNNGKK